MAVTKIADRRQEFIKEYAVVYKPQGMNATQPEVGGFWFPSNKEGEIEAQKGGAAESLAYCLANPEEFNAPVLFTISRTIYRPAVWCCECGREFELDSFMT